MVQASYLHTIKVNGVLSVYGLHPLCCIDKSSALKRLIAINCIQNKSFVCIIYVCLCSVYI